MEFSRRYRERLYLFTNRRIANKMNEKIETTKTNLVTGSQIIFDFSGDELRIDSLISRFKEYFMFGGFSVSEEKAISYSDDYYDTADGYCRKSSQTLRIRTNYKGYTAIIKKPAKSDLGIQTRDGVHVPIPNAEVLSKLKSTNFERLIEEHLPSFKGMDLLHVLTISNNRREFIVSKRNSKYVVRFDVFDFGLPNSSVKSRKQTEIEIKVLNVKDTHNVAILRDRIAGVFTNLKYLHDSKYHRAQKFLRRYQTNLVYKLYKLLSEHVILTTIILIIGVVGSVASIYGVVFG